MLTGCACVLGAAEAFEDVLRSPDDALDCIGVPSALASGVRSNAMTSSSESSSATAAGRSRGAVTSETLALAPAIALIVDGVASHGAPETSGSSAHCVNSAREPFLIHSLAVECAKHLVLITM